jgi:hypothetical protein
MTTTINPATIITDIRVAMVAYHRRTTEKNADGLRLSLPQYREAEGPHRSMIREAAHLFGRINGWHTGAEVRDFRVCDIGKRSGNWPVDLGSEFFDHCIYYRGAGKCAAVVAQPYEHAKDAYGQRLATKHGVACHIPPHPFASFHFPGWTKFYVFTSADHAIQWLPEQVNGFADPTVFAPLTSTHGKSNVKRSV